MTTRMKAGSEETTTTKVTITAMLEKKITTANFINDKKLNISNKNIITIELYLWDPCPFSSDQRLICQVRGRGGDRGGCYGRVGCSWREGDRRRGLGVGLDTGEWEGVGGMGEVRRERLG